MARASNDSVHLVGSLPFKSASQVFEVTGRALAGYARRLPDGEAQGWVRYPGASLASARGLKLGSRTGQTQPELPKFGLYEIDGTVDAADLMFAPVGYDRIALASYEMFKQARAEGHIDPGTRFQVSLPTPFAVIGQFVIPEHVEQVMPAFERHYLREVGRILDGIPYADLAIQWDIAVELVEALHGRRAGLGERISRDYLTDATSRIVEAIPPEVEVGIHLCYGNPGGRHVIEPDDTALMAAFATETSRKLARALDWVHMPVPKNRSDDAYFSPLKDLRIGGTRLYLGLVHLGDGEQGNRRRIDAARKYVDGFGVAYECGLRTFPAESIATMLELHKSAADYVASFQ